LRDDDDYSVPPDDRKNGNEVGEHTQIPQLGFLGLDHSRERTLTDGSKICENSVSKFWGVILPLFYEEKRANVSSKQASPGTVRYPILLYRLSSDDVILLQRTYFQISFVQLLSELDKISKIVATAVMKGINGKLSLGLTSSK
jgi:hypothetical protein